MAVLLSQAGGCKWCLVLLIFDGEIRVWGQQGLMGEWEGEGEGEEQWANCTVFECMCGSVGIAERTCLEGVRMCAVLTLKIDSHIQMICSSVTLQIC